MNERTLVAFSSRSFTPTTTIQPPNSRHCTNYSALAPHNHPSCPKHIHDSSSVVRVSVHRLFSGKSRAASSGKMSTTICSLIINKWNHPMGLSQRGPWRHIGGWCKQPQLVGHNPLQNRSDEPSSLAVTTRALNSPRFDRTDTNEDIWFS